MNYIDLFSGAGGLGLGFEEEGFTNLFSVEFDENAANTYKYNFPNNQVIVENIKNITNEQIKKLINNQHVDLVIGGPPCQGFSIAGNIGRKFIDDERNHLFKEFVRVVSIAKPKMFLMENVARMATHNHGKTIQEILSEFKSIGYNVQFKVLNSVDYSVPQNRRRIFIIGTTGQQFSYPVPESKILTIKDAISDLPPLKNGEFSTLPNHFAMNHSKQMLKKMSYVKDGGDRYDIPEDIRPKSGDARKYIRYNSNEPSITITGDMRKVFHYSQNRALSPRELARIQTFPDNFIFKGNSISIQQQIGNAVPPKLARALAIEIKKSLLQDGKAPKNTVYPKVNYIGNKDKLSEWIADNVPDSVDTILDLFSGGGSVSYELKKRGFEVFSNDVLYSSYVLNKALIENNNVVLSPQSIKEALKLKVSSNEISRLKWLENKLFFPEEIPELAKLVKYSYMLEGYQRYLFLSLLRRSMIRKLPYSRMNITWENIVKLRDEEYSYKKYKRRRAYHNKPFSEHMLKEIDSYNHAVFSNTRNNRAFQLDALDMLDTISHVDLIYLDPPYPGTMNNYAGFYGDFDKIFDKNINYTDLTRSNIFINQLEKIINKAANISNYMLLSINSNIKPSYKDVENMCMFYGQVDIISKKHNYQVSGKENKNKNTELLLKIKFYK
ncbi:DNA (cytosine-5-)-methyltransferase [Ligilactobacillus salivarius]|uniref:DNA (cytosine-5-)-methyltransferase n=1 Tax=Ligilactobacillus salivarius TaxID=1624 RepID=UPI003B017550